MRRTAAIFLFTAIFSVFSTEIRSQKAASSTRSGVQRFAQKGLKDNKYYIYYIDFTITNYGTDAEKEKLREIVKRDIMCQILYLRFSFRESFKYIRINQKELVSLYRKKLSDEQLAIKALLDSFAPSAVNSEDPKAKLYLTLGYRELSCSKAETIMADNYKPLLYSLRLHRYSRAMKRLKEAKRFAILSRIQMNMPPEEKIKEKILTFEEILAKLPSVSSEDDLDRIKLLHYDSYYKSMNGGSVSKDVWNQSEITPEKPVKEDMELKPQ